MRFSVLIELFCGFAVSNRPQCPLLLGRVMALFPGKDRDVREAKIQVDRTTFVRLFAIAFYWNPA